MEGFRLLIYLTTIDTKRSGTPISESQRTLVQFPPLVAHYCARKVNGFQHVPGLGVYGPILSIKEDACANGLDERRIHRCPVCRICDLWDLGVQIVNTIVSL